MLAGLIGRVSNKVERIREERCSSSLIYDKIWDSITKLERQGTSTHTQPAVSYAEYTRQRAGTAHHQDFQLDLVGEGQQY